MASDDHAFHYLLFFYHVDKHSSTSRGEKNNIPAQNCLLIFNMASSAVLNLITPDHKA